MNCVGIDVSKGKSMIAVMRPFGEVVISPFEVQHTASELSELAKLLKSLDGETRVVMESTGNYHTPVAWLLHDAGLYVSVVNAMLVHDYGNNSLRRAKTDKKDAVKLANYGLDHWLTLPRYVPEEDTRLLLQYIWTGKPGSQSGFPSISCLSYNERSNWLTITSLGFYVRRKDCQSSSCCSVRFEQVEPPDAGEFASHNRLNRQREKMDSGCRFLVLEECK